jgi:tight adherence protein B
MNGVPIALIGLTIAIILMPSGGVFRRLRAPSAVRLRLPSFDLSRAVRRPARLLLTAGATGGVAGVLLGGPVAGVVLAIYLVLAARAVVRRTVRRAAVAARARELDDLSALAAELRAGLPRTAVPAASGTASAPVFGLTSTPASGAVSAPPSVADPGRASTRVTAIWALADQTGAPAADLVERIEADARAADRARASAAAEAAGAQATAMLLAALPVGGILLGFGLGANPVRILLHTPVGAACAIAAVLLQSAGLLWAERLAGGAVR